MKDPTIVLQKTLFSKSKIIITFRIGKEIVTLNENGRIKEMEATEEQVKHSLKYLSI
jgi:hypothetical protein